LGKWAFADNYSRGVLGMNFASGEKRELKSETNEKRNAKILV